MLIVLDIFANKKKRVERKGGVGLLVLDGEENSLVLFLWLTVVCGSMVAYIQTREGMSQPAPHASANYAIVRK